MSISSSLAAGVAGLNANAQRLASISDNIANSSTFGYKRVATDFHSMVVREGGNAQYTAGGVRTSTERLIDRSGQIETTANPTDIAITGRGFLPVAQSSALRLPGTPPLSLMTTGSFRPDQNGILTNANGMVLMGWPAGNDGTFPAFPRDSGDGLRPVDIRHNQYSANPTTSMTMAVNLPSSQTEAGAAGLPIDLTMEYFGNLSQTENLLVTFTPTVPANGASNTWTMQIADSASDGAVVAEYTLTYSDDPVGGGLLETVTTVIGGAYDPATGRMDIPTASGTIAFDIGRPGQTSGMTQLDTTFAPTTLNKNGSAVGNLLGVEIQPDGVIHAVYDSGFTRPIYQVPIIDVPNPNGLTSGDGQTYKISADSGPMFLWDAGTGPVGETAGYAREASTTDIALELTQLIQTQRAYSSNAKIIQTVDEMLQETTNLKR